MNINLNLDIKEVQGILEVLGNLPTSSGAYPLAMKIKEQAESQILKNLLKRNKWHLHLFRISLLVLQLHSL